MMDLFSYAESYPVSAGYRATDTSRAAAESIPASIIRGKVLRIFELRGACTADEVADALHTSVLSIRPRVSELHKLGKLMDTGDRRPNASQRSAIVWKIP